MMPHDEILEKTVLGTLIDQPETWPEIAETFHLGLFYKEVNRIVARGILTLKNENKAADLMGIILWVKSQGLGDLCPAYEITTLTNNRAYFGITEKVMVLHQYHLRRELLLNAHKTIGAVEQSTCDPLEVIAEQEKSLNELTHTIATSKTFDAQDCQIEMINHLDKLAKLTEGELIGVDTGFKRINELSAGWRKTDLIILAGRPGMGKTSLALNLTRSALVKTPVLFFSFEMPKLQIYARMCSQITQIPLGKFLREKMSKEERDIFNSLTWNLSQSHLYVEDRATNLNNIKRKARKMKREKGIGLIVIDHLGFIQKPKNNKSTNDQVGEITSELKGLAKELELPIILLCQLNRGSEKAKNTDPPELKDLRDSGNIEQDADTVIFVYRPEYYGITDDGQGNSTVGKAEVIIKKHRNGGLDNVLVGFDGKCTNFYDLSSNRFQENKLEPNYQF